MVSGESQTARRQDLLIFATVASQCERPILVQESIVDKHNSHGSYDSLEAAKSL